MLQITHIAVKYTVCLGENEIQYFWGEIITCDSSIHYMDYSENSFGLKRDNYILFKCALKLFDLARRVENLNCPLAYHQCIYILYLQISFLIENYFYLFLSNHVVGTERTVSMRRHF